MKFTFKAKNSSGEIKEGVIESANSDMAIQILQKSGLLPFVVVPQKESENSFQRIFAKMYESVASKELVVFFRQFSIMIEARVPVVNALLAIKEQTSNKYFEIVIKDVIASVEDGIPLSNAMEKFKDVFPVLAINIIRSGETSGNLKKSMEYVADNIERNYNLTSRVKSALMYPAVILIVFFIIGFIVATIIIPKLSVMIKDLGATVPWYTKMVIAFGDFMESWWWAVLVLIIGVIGGIIYYIKTDNGRDEFDEVKLKLPLIGSIFSGLYVSRFAENLAVLLAGGIPIVQAIRVTSDVVGNSLYRELLLKAADEVKNGGNMSDTLRKSTLMPAMVSHMVKIGEDSGQIDSVLNHVAKFYDQETEMSTRNLSTLIEPILMIFIGLAVGFLAFSVLMPIYDIAGQIK